tara:strand:+ start:7694 stop:7867 length:174 start_codon:yes stop_codon:yes gene_type:complete
MNIDNNSPLSYYYAQYSTVAFRKQNKVADKEQKNNQIKKVSSVAASRNDIANSNQRT